MEPLRPEPQSITTPLDPAIMRGVREDAYRAGVPAAEVLRNLLVTDGIEIASMRLDGCVAVSADFDAELAALIKYETDRERYGDDA